MNFKKMHGLGNDFVILDFRSEGGALNPAQIIKICDRHLGIGCDQLVVLEPSNAADLRATFYNPDASQSGACGNASRCIADIIMNEQGSDNCAIETGGGILRAERTGDLITIDMGAPNLGWAQIPLAEERDTNMLYLDESSKNPAVAVNMGNPHCVIFVEDAEQALVDRIGPKVENHLLFPERTNVEFVQALEDGSFRQRTWERGAGETLACGSGACAVAVAAIQRNLTDERTVQIHLNGGTLSVEWRETDGRVYMTGPVAYVFDGKLRP